MSQILRADCKYSTYIESFNQNRNTSSERSIFIGNAYNRTSSRNNLYVSLLKFNLPVLDASRIKNASLFLYFENLKSYNEVFENIIISQNNSDFDLSSICWRNPPKLSNSNTLEITIPYNYIGSYVKINITPIVMSWMTSRKNYGLTIRSSSNRSTSLIQFASANSSNAPYIIIKLNDEDNLDCDNSNYEDTNTKYDSSYKYQSKNLPNDNCDFNSSISREDFDTLTSSVDKLNAETSSLYNSIKEIESDFKCEIDNLKKSISNLEIHPNSDIYVNSTLDEMNEKLDSLDKKYLNGLNNLDIKLDNSISAIREDIIHEIKQFKDNYSQVPNDNSYCHDEIERLRKEIELLKLMINKVTIEPIN